MRQGMAIVVAGLLWTMPALSRPPVQDKPAKAADAPAQMVSTAQITKIDTKKQTMKVRNIAASMNDGSISPSNNGAARRSGGGIPGGMGIPGGRRGGMGLPHTGGSGAPNTNASNGKLGPEYTVYIAKQTVFKDGEEIIHLQDFRVGDKINITGTQKGSGKDMNASVISRAN